MTDTKPSLLIIYDYFFPAYRAGGPFQSLTNLIIQLQHEYKISVITSAFDLGTGQLHNIKTDSWSEIILPGADVPVNTWYAGAGKPGIAAIKGAIRHAKPSIVYLNGMFSVR